MSQIYDSLGIQKAGTISTVDCISVSAGSLSSCLSAVTFGDGGGVSFGLDTAGVVTASAAGGTGGGAITFSAGTTSATLGSVVFTNTNGVSFGLTGSTISASVAPLTVSASNGSYTASTLKFTNSNGVTFGTGTAGVTASVATDYAVSTHTHSQYLTTAAASTHTHASTQGSIRLSADGVTSGSFSALTFATSAGNVTFGLDTNGVITASAATGTGAQSNQTLSLHVTTNTTGNTSVMTVDARSLVISAGGAFNAGFSTSAGGSTIMLRGPSMTNEITASGNTTGATSTASFTRSYNVWSAAGGMSIGFSTTTGSSNTVIFSAPVSGAATDHTHGAISFDLSRMTASASSASNGLTIGLTGPNVVPAMDDIDVVAGGATGHFTQVAFENTNGVSWGLSTAAASKGTVTASVAAQSVQTLSFLASSNTTASTNAWTANATALTVRGEGAVSVGGSGGELVISGATAAPGGGATLSFFQYPYLISNTTVYGLTGNAFRVDSFILPQAVSFDQWRIIGTVACNTATNSTSYTTSSATRTFQQQTITAYSVQFFTRGTGTNSSILISTPGGPPVVSHTWLVSGTIAGNASEFSIVRAWTYYGDAFTNTASTAHSESISSATYTQATTWFTNHAGRRMRYYTITPTSLSAGNYWIQFAQPQTTSGAGATWFGYTPGQPNWDVVGERLSPTYTYLPLGTATTGNSNPDFMLGPIGQWSTTNAYTNTQSTIAISAISHYGNWAVGYWAISRVA